VAPPTPDVERGPARAYGGGKAREPGSAQPIACDNPTPRSRRRESALIGGARLSVLLGGPGRVEESWAGDRLSYVDNRTKKPVLMKKIALITILGLSTFALSARAQLFGVSIGRHGVSVGIGVPAYCPPPAVVYTAPPAYYPPVSYYAPPTYYAAPPYYPAAPAVVYSAPPCYSYGPRVVVGAYGYDHSRHGSRGGYWHR
jgi:hypothetical protein